MSQNRASLLDSLLNFLSKLFGSEPPPAPPATPPGQPSQPQLPADDAPLAPLEPRVLVIVYDPIIDRNSGLRLTAWGQQNRGWQAVDQLLQGYIGDVAECSGNLVKYRVVERLDVDEFAVKLDGFRYTWDTYLPVLQRPDTYHQPDAIDYHQILKDFRVLERVAANEIDEVWLFAYPFAGTWESSMAGKGAFYCNSAPLEGTDSCPRRFIIMGFSYERGVGEMEEDLAHRTESLMGRIYGCQDFVNWTYAWDRSKEPYVKLDPTKYDAVKYAATNTFAKFLLFDRIAPGNSQCGNVHYAPNSQKDYEWGNMMPVVTYADDWLTFPNLPGVQKMTNANSWGNGDIRGHHRWWFTRFPKVAGRTNGVRNNWWAYIAAVANSEFDAY